MMTLLCRADPILFVSGTLGATQLDRGGNVFKDTFPLEARLEDSMPDGREGFDGPTNVVNRDVASEHPIEFSGGILLVLICASGLHLEPDWE
jgi:hypothetical protein